jgi:hypothetical protein
MECTGGEECALTAVSRLLSRASAQQLEHYQDGGTLMNPDLMTLTHLHNFIRLSVCPRTRKMAVHELPHWDEYVNGLRPKDRRWLTYVIRQELARPSQQDSGSWAALLPQPR